MINYFNTYRSFLLKKGVRTNSRVKARKMKMELHHEIPKCMGGTRGDNLIALTSYDHGIAHLLLTVALMQQGKKDIGYGYPPCLRKGTIDISKYWNVFEDYQQIVHFRQFLRIQVEI